ncbi:FKBP-type peptidyl-prolyl cis-trans isomerase [Cecembia lonarensis]|uniref:Peptidyl-prolyl cis-trans isomerase n=1 Tax=Cecembia lonarensis (strain CCUG 58316 / KCTC 22772 / LW9) TaxID=1225176 RepID=K1KY10_CECL9|nr:FKBP-type peptidyl-prolyl cis-trans isomerase [Cecembia lonarensis]EKB47376.1 FK506-binding protein [Cecembia lonarensis LW9]
MKKFIFGIFTSVFLLSGCISESENQQVIFDRDLQAIEDYIQRNPIASVKEFVDPGLGIRIYWQEVSESGKSPESPDMVKVDYVGKLLNGSVFDTSFEQVARDNNIFDPQRPYGPIEYIFGVGEVIPGFDFAISLMEEGDKVTAFIPSIFGYGAVSQPGIPRNSVLIFELDLVQVGTVTEDELPDE